MEYEKILEMICTAEKKAGERILHAHDIMPKNKTDARNVVTEYDTSIQQMLMDTFSAALPGAHFFCEEMDNPDSLDAEHVFVIDPIDGTMNFVRGFHHSCISTAYMNRGVISAAAIYNPYVDEMFTAIAGKGAWLNGKKLEIENVSLAESVVCFGSAPYYRDTRDRTLELVRASLDIGLDIRREGSAALDLCSVASGRAGVFFEMLLSFWDFAAGMLIATEAGAEILTVDGEPLPLNGSKSSVLCGAPDAVRDFLSLGR